MDSSAPEVSQVSTAQTLIYHTTPYTFRYSAPKEPQYHPVPAENTYEHMEFSLFQRKDAKVLKCVQGIWVKIEVGATVLS